MTQNIFPACIIWMCSSYIFLRYWVMKTAIENVINQMSLAKDCNRKCLKERLSIYSAYHRSIALPSAIKATPHPSSASIESKERNSDSFFSFFLSLYCHFDQIWLVTISCCRDCPISLLQSDNGLLHVTCTVNCCATVRPEA